MKKLLIVIPVILSLFLTLGYFSINRSSPKVGYVNVAQLYSEFELKKEMQAKLTKVGLARKSILDSMEIQVRSLARKVEDSKGKDKAQYELFEMKREEFSNKKKQFDEDNDATIKQFDDQISTQLTQYLKDFGSKSGYKMILGAQGNGSLMYADETLNITTQVSEYINKRYKGVTE